VRGKSLGFTIAVMIVNLERIRWDYTRESDGIITGCPNCEPLLVPFPVRKFPPHPDLSPPKKKGERGSQARNFWSGNGASGLARVPRVAWLATWMALSSSSNGRPRRGVQSDLARRGSCRYKAPI